MSDRTDLSADTWIETRGGVRYLVSKSKAVAADWPFYEAQYDSDSPSALHPAGSWICGLTDLFLYAKVFRIPLTACWKIYRYRDGEPWAWINRQALAVNPNHGTHCGAHVIETDDDTLSR